MRRPVRLRRLLASSALLASCSSGGAMPTPPGPDSADLAMPSPSDADGGASDLAKSAPDLRTPPDPASCPSGVSDGCCPLVVGASRDPDCPALDCAKLTPGAAIPIDVIGIGAGRSGYGQTAMAWMGSDLALAFTTMGDMDQGRVIYQRRNEAGDLTYGPIDSPLPSGATPAAAGPTVLVYEPSQRAFVVGHTASALRYAAFGMDLLGNPTWGTTLGELCNTMWVNIDGYSVAGEAFLGQQNMTCAGSTYWPRVDAMTFDGKNLRSWALGDGMRGNLTAKGAFAYDRGSKRLFAIWNRLYEGSIGARYVDPMSGPTTPLTLHNRPGGTDNYEHLGVVYDGRRFGILVERRISYAGYARHFEIYDPVSGMVEGPLAMPGGGQAMLPPSMLWTGDGYLAAAMFFDGPNTPLGEPQKFTSYIYSFAKDGTLRETIPVDTGPAVYPKLAWAGGRIALTWVRPTGMNPGHYLKFFSCF